MQSGKGKNRFLGNFPDILAVFNQIEATFLTTNSMDVRACTLRTYVHAPLGRTSINLRTYVHRNIHLKKEKLCPKTAILWLTRVAYLPARESSAENIAILEAFEKAKSKEWLPIASQYVSWLLFGNNGLCLMIIAPRIMRAGLFPAAFLSSYSQNTTYLP